MTGLRVFAAVALSSLALGCAPVSAEPEVAVPAEVLQTDVRFSDSAINALSREHRVLIEEIAASAHAEVRALLPALPAQMVVQVDAGPAVIPDTGEVGSSISPGVVGWTVNPSHPDGADRIIRAHLRTTLFHEFHHQVRGWTFQGNPPPTSIMDAVVAEGMASAFARDFAGANVPWASHPEEADDWLADLQQNGSLAQYMQWMFEHPDGRRWIGYRTGVYVVDRAIAASGQSAAELVRVPTAQVLEMATADAGS